MPIYCKVLSIQALFAEVIELIFLSKVGPHYSLNAIANLGLPVVCILLPKSKALDGFYGEIGVISSYPKLPNIKRDLP